MRVRIAPDSRLRVGGAKGRVGRRLAHGGQDLPRFRRDQLGGDGIAGAEHGYVAGDVSRGALAECHLADQRVGERAIDGAIHPAERGLDLLRAHHPDDAALGQVHPQRLGDGAAQERVAGAVPELGDEDPVARAHAAAREQRGVGVPEQGANQGIRRHRQHGEPGRKRGPCPQARRADGCRGRRARARGWCVRRARAGCERRGERLSGFDGRRRRLTQRVAECSGLGRWLRGEFAREPLHQFPVHLQRACAIAQLVEQSDEPPGARLVVGGQLTGAARGVERADRVAGARLLIRDRPEALRRPQPEAAPHLIGPKLEVGGDVGRGAAGEELAAIELDRVGGPARTQGRLERLHVAPEAPLGDGHRFVGTAEEHAVAGELTQVVECLPERAAGLVLSRLGPEQGQERLAPGAGRRREGQVRQQRQTLGLRRDGLVDAWAGSHQLEPAEGVQSQHAPGGSRHRTSNEAVARG